jgi:hypothetical protein
MKANAYLEPLLDAWRLSRCQSSQYALADVFGGYRTQYDAIERNATGTQRLLPALAGLNRKIGLTVPERYSALLGAVAAWPSVEGWIVLTFFFVLRPAVTGLMKFYGLFSLRKLPSRNSLFNCWQAFLWEVLMLAAV